MTDTVTLDVVGTSETSEILKVEPGRISRWVRDEKLPPPYATPRCSPVWLRVDIERFLENGKSVEGVEFTEPSNDLLGRSDVADLLGVDKSQVGRWWRNPPKSGPRFPEPTTKIAAGPLWSRRDILNFAEARKAA